MNDRQRKIAALLALQKGNSGPFLNLANQPLNLKHIKPGQVKVYMDLGDRFIGPDGLMEEAAFRQATHETIKNTLMIDVDIRCPKL